MINTKNVFLVLFSNSRILTKDFNLLSGDSNANNLTEKNSKVDSNNSSPIISASFQSLSPSSNFINSITPSTSLNLNTTNLSTSSTLEKTTITPQNATFDKERNNEIVLLNDDKQSNNENTFKSKERVFDASNIELLQDNIFGMNDNFYTKKETMPIYSNKKNSKEFISIKTSAGISPIRPVSVIRGGIPFATFDDGISPYTHEKCENGNCKNSEKLLQSEYVTQPCTARQISDPCAPKITPFWSEWSLDGFCSMSCGHGVRPYRRFCSHENKCPGEATKKEPCKIVDCGVWSLWSEWSRCTVSCGENGQMIRERKCENSTMCDGPSVDLRACNDNPCPKYSEWSAWTTECSASCGSGWRTRERSCVANNNQKCDESQMHEHQPCKLQACPSWEQWTGWSQCSKSCNSGEMTRFRKCISGREDNCIEPNNERKKCNTQQCPIWMEWTLWSTCSQTCGNAGTRLRTRECRYQNLASNLCEGSAQDQTTCQLEPCPYWAEWGDWSRCSTSCGHGQQKRIRHCKPNGLGCKGGDQEIRFCQQAVCPYFEEWTEWSGCSVTCGHGFCERRRNNLILTPYFNEKQNKSLNKTLNLRNDLQNDSIQSKSNSSLLNSYETKELDKDYNLLETASINHPRLRGQPLEVAQSSLMNRKRSVNDKNLNNHASNEFNHDTNLLDCIGPEVERKQCDAGPCCNWMPWTSWGLCNTKCGVGFRTRNRKCIVKPDSSTSVNSDYSHDLHQNIEQTNGYQSINASVARPKRQQQFGFLQSQQYGLLQPTLNDKSGPSTRFSSSSNYYPSFPSTPISGTCNCVGRSVEVEECSNTDPCIHSTTNLINGKYVEQPNGLLQKKQDYSLFFNERQHSSCVWEEWANWSACVGTCTKALHSRNRKCYKGHLNCDCIGEDYEIEECQPLHCNQIFATSILTNKTIYPILPLYDSNILNKNGKNFNEQKIIKSSYENNNNPIENDCYWEKWTQWSVCDANTYLKKRTRLCIESKAIINYCKCHGESIEQISCNDNNVNSSQVVDVERSLVNFTAIVSTDIKSNLNKNDRFQDLYWNESLNNSTTNKIESVNTENDLNEKNNCKWLEWMSWSNCLPFTLDTEKEIEGERKRSRICPCSSCEDGISEESESCILNR